MKILANNYKANETFKFLRQGLDLTQEELAKNIKASKSSIEKYEYGTVNYTFETLLKIADKYNLNIIIETKKQTSKSEVIFSLFFQNYRG